MPMGLLRAYVRMLPRLTAEASIAAAERTGVGIGLWRSPEGAQQAIALWQRTADAGRVPVAGPEGLPVRRVRVSGAAPPGMGFARVEVPVAAPGAPGAPDGGAE